MNDQREIEVEQLLGPLEQDHLMPLEKHSTHAVHI